MYTLGAKGSPWLRWGRKTYRYLVLEASYMAGALSGVVCFDYIRDQLRLNVAFMRVSEELLLVIHG